jgi:SAM-dependent methyltransferase
MVMGRDAGASRDDADSIGASGETKGAPLRWHAHGPETAESTRMRRTPDMKDMWNERAKRDALFYVESEHWSGDVAAFFDLGERRAKAIIDEVLDQHLDPSRRASALDLGCGVGRFSRALGRRFDVVTALDVSEEMIEQARRLHAAPEFGNLHFASTSGTDAGTVPDGSIDFAFSYEVFQHMPSADVIRRNVSAIARALRPDGLALLHFRTEPALSTWTLKRIVRRALPERALPLLGRPPFTHDASWTGTTMTMRKIRAMCEAAGLALVSDFADPTHPPGTRRFIVARPQTM